MYFNLLRKGHREDSIQGARGLFLVPGVFFSVRDLLGGPGSWSLTKAQPCLGETINQPTSDNSQGNVKESHEDEIIGIPLPFKRKWRHSPLLDFGPV
jgi:hypothetical protein